MSQPYEGATGSPRGDTIPAPSIGPNTAIAASGATLRNRSRHGYRNSALLRSAIDKGVTAEVGKGVVIKSLVANDETRKTLNDLWKSHQLQLDPWGVKSFGGILDVAVRARQTAGEVFIRRVPVSLSMGMKVPFQVEVLESEFCPMGFNKRLANGRRIVQGIELVGRRKVAIYFHKRHPSEYEFDSVIRLDDLVRVPIRDVIHHYKELRPGQLRGEPSTAAALLKIAEFDAYSDAELTRKKTRSAMTGFLTRDSFDEDDLQFDPMTGQAMFDDVDAPQEREVIQTGTMLRGLPGEKVTLFDGDVTGGGFKDFVKWQAQQVAAAVDIPYPLLTGDWEGLSDRTIRAIMNEYRRGVVADQNNLLKFQVCLKVWTWMVECCILNGLISAPGFADNPWQYFALDVQTDAWRHLQPEQDQRARSLAMQSMLSNPEKEASECGTDLEDNMKATARSMRMWNEICEEEGIDPTKVNAFSLVNNEQQPENDAP